MISVPDYHLATNCAYNTLRLLHIDTLPVDVEWIMNHYRNVELLSYSKLKEKFHLSESDLFSMGISSYGFTLKKPKKFIVLYNNEQDECIIRFTLAHELGHMYLLHTTENSKSDKEANCFARNFLCPIPIVNTWNLSDPDDYVDIFNVSPPMAETSIKFQKQDLFNISNENYSSISSQFSLNCLTKQMQLKKYRARYAKCIQDFAGII